MNLFEKPWQTLSGPAPPPPDNMIAAARAQADSYAEMIGLDSYPRAAPNLSGFISDDTDLKRFFLKVLSNPRMNTPPEEVYLLRDAYVGALARTYMLYSRDHEIFSPSRIDQDTVYPFVSFADLCGGTIPVLDSRAISIFKIGTANYGHLLVEMLPRLENIAPLIDDPTRLLVPPLVGTMAEQLQSLVDFLYPGKFVIEQMRTPIVHVRELIYAGPISNHRPPRKSRTLLRFAEKLRQLAPSPTSAGSPKRIYVSREGITKRRMLNEADIRAAFEAHGYVSVQPERLTLLEQVALFASATHIAGPIGAGLTNTIFAPETAHVLTLDSGIQDFFFWDLACLRGQSFTWHFGKPLARFDVACLHAEYEMPEAPVRALLGILD